jgi:hypothetical protein
VLNNGENVTQKIIHQVIQQFLENFSKKSGQKFKAFL